MSRETLLAYFDAIEQQLLALPNFYVEQFTVTILSPERANLKLRARLQAKYLLAVSEALRVIDGQVTQLDYRYHFQDENNQLIFRYDSTPHFPDLASFPHHKHCPRRLLQPTSQTSLQSCEKLAVICVDAVATLHSNASTLVPSTLQHQGDRPIILNRHLHHCPKLPRLHPQPTLPQPRHKLLIQVVCNRWGRSLIK